MKQLIFIALLLFAQLAYSQEHGFRYGATYRDMAVNRYEPDTTAYAVVLNEFGEAFFENGGDHRLIYKYHVKIKILRQEGLSRADVLIPIFRHESVVEEISEIRASSFNLVDGSLKETKIESKSIFTERVDETASIKKLAIPNVQVGSVIEYSYTIFTPFTFNFREWKFQDDIPKIQSEFWATIPATHNYNISLRGYLKLDKNEHEVIRACFHTADCSRLKWAMKDVPAFLEEAYMTAPSNYMAAIRFELSDLQFFDGTKRKITKEWRDVADELRRSEDFGLQLRRGKDIVDEHIEAVIAGETDSLAKAKRIYDFIKGWYSWNGEYSKRSEFGIKKAFDQKKGNVADINLSLIAALRYAGLNADPLLLSTRKHGSVTELFPVLSEFNYVVACVKINKKIYMLDATEDLYPFGLLPERCLNGKGRLIDNRESHWLDLYPTEKSKKINVINLTLTEDGKINGTIQTSYFGYEAVSMREKILNAGSEQQFIEGRMKENREFVIEKMEVQNAFDVSKQLIVKSTIAYAPFDNLKAPSLYNPFLTGKWTNPFKSKERVYPVDFGAPKEEVLIFVMQVPASIELIDTPPKVGLAIPNSGGRFIHEVKQTGNVIALNQSVQISKSFYDANEYRYLRELYDNVIAVQQTDLVLTTRN
jgi:hypothetical protein